MNTVRIPFASKTIRDQTLGVLEFLDYDKLDSSEVRGAGIRAQAGELVEGIRVPDARRSIVFRGEHIPQWVVALSALVAWKAGQRTAEKPWAEVFVDNELVLVAATSLDVRGTRGLMEVDEEGRLLAWRDGGQNPYGPQADIQRQAVEKVIAALLDAKVRKRLKKTRVNTSVAI